MPLSSHLSVVVSVKTVVVAAAAIVVVIVNSVYTRSIKMTKLIGYSN